MTMKPLCGLMMFAFAIFVLQEARSQTFTVDFESPAASGTFGFPVSLPGDLIFSENGIGVSLETFTNGMSTSFVSLDIPGFTGSSFSTTPATINNVRLGFDLSGLPGPVSSASFEFVDFGGVENLVINGSVLELNQFTDAPSSLAGVNISVIDVPGGIGSVSLTGPITDLAIGGQEIGIDNVAFSVVPEPTGGILLAIAGLGTLLKRRRFARH